MNSWVTDDYKWIAPVRRNRWDCTVDQKCYLVQFQLQTISKDGRLSPRWEIIENQRSSVTNRFIGDVRDNLQADKRYVGIVREGHSG